MLKIMRIPDCLMSFFSSLKTEFHWDHFSYFADLVMAIAVSFGRRNVSSLYRRITPRAHRTRYNNFLNLSRWDYQGALRRKVYELLAALRPGPRDTVHIIIDDSKKSKRGKTMEAVSSIFDPVSNRSVRGHQYITAVIECRGHVIPFGIRLYVKKQDCKALDVRFKKVTQLAAELIREFQAPEWMKCKIRVLFDSYYCCPVVTKACSEKRFRWVSVLKSNRNLLKNGRKLKTGKYGRNLFRRGAGRRHTLEIGGTSYTYVDPGQMRVGKLGEVHVVFSRKGRGRGILALATDDPDLSAEDIIKTYRVRWQIEVFFKDSKQLLGLGQYQNGSYQAAVIHLHLVCFARALLTHLAIEREGAKGKAKRRRAAQTSCGELQNALREIVWEDVLAALEEKPDMNSVVKELRALRVAA